MTFELAPDAAQEAERVVAHVRNALAAGLRDVAILARARSHFASIHEALRAAEIPYQAVKLESLAERPVTLDFLWLARALTQPADRHAWLTVLRAPWCALQLPDLLAMADAANTRAMGSVARDPATLALLSVDGAARLARFSAATADALYRRDMALAVRVRGAWLALGGPACYGADRDRTGGAVDMLAADAFFAALARHDRGGDLPDWERFVDAIAALQSEPPAAGDTRVKLMTLHAAKGLEFDAVILPGLGNATRGGDQKLLRWRTQGGDLIIGSPPAAPIPRTIPSSVTCATWRPMRTRPNWRGSCTSGLRVPAIACISSHWRTPVMTGKTPRGSGRSRPGAPRSAPCGPRSNRERRGRGKARKIQAAPHPRGKTHRRCH